MLLLSLAARFQVAAQLGEHDLQEPTVQVAQFAAVLLEIVAPLRNEPAVLRPGVLAGVLQPAGLLLNQLDEHRQALARAE